jgi:hypothetical protein
MGGRRARGEHAGGLSLGGVARADFRPAFSRAQARPVTYLTSVQVGSGSLRSATRCQAMATSRPSTASTQKPRFNQRG